MQTPLAMPPTILVLLFGDLGDTLLTVPALRSVRGRFPASQVVVMGKSGPAELVRDLGLVDDVIAVDKHALDRPKSLFDPRTSFRALRLVHRLRRQRVDQLLIFQHFSTRWGAFKYAMLSLATGARVRAGLDNGRGWFLTHRVHDRGFGAVHEAQYWLQVAALVGANGTLDLEAPISDDDLHTAAALLSEVGLESRPILAVHPGVGPYGPGRQWGASRFAQATAIILSQSDLECIIVGSDTDRKEAEAVSAHLGSRVKNLVGRTTTGQLAALLQHCCLLLSNDGGVAHLASAVGTRTLTVFGPSNDAAWRPLSGEVIAADLPCRPCFYRDFDVGLRHGCVTRECLSQVTPFAVAERVLSIVEATSVVA